jgi:nicotinate-nucleotide adenylyltransferase
VARVGLLGGTFNPPHSGHLVCASEARDQLALDVVRLVPAAVPPHKEVAGDPGVAVRLELCRLAVAGDEHLEVCDIEAGRPGPSFTVDTLRALHDESPGDELTFIVGGDQAHGLPGWREPERVLELARLAVVEREELRRRELLERLSGLRGVPERVAFFTMPRLDVSSTLLRRRVAERRSLRHLVPDAVADRVAALGLYRVGAGAWA